MTPDLPEATGPIEPDGARVALADGKMRARGARCRHRIAPAADEPPPDPMPLQAGEKIDVQVRGIGIHNAVWQP